MGAASKTKSAEPAFLPAVGRAKTLLDLALEFKALVDVDETELDTESLELLRQEQAASLSENRQKVDRFGYLIESVLADTEVRKARIQREKDAIDANQRVVERCRQFAEYVIRRLGTDKEGDFHKLKGEAFTFALKKVADALVIEDESEVPTEWKRATVKFQSAELWERLLSQAFTQDQTGVTPDELAKECAVTYEVRRGDVTKALRQEQSVPGAGLSWNRYSLQGDCFKAMKQKDEDA